jgi:hypothetical protein
MALKLADVAEEMKKLLQAAGESRSEILSQRILDMAGDFLLRALVRDPEKGAVAILMVMPADEQMTFVFPRYLARGNTLPLDQESFAGRVVLRGEVLVENRVPNEPHKEYFERIPDDRGSVRSIQKMIAAPLVADGRAIGVVEVSRTGTTAAEAGPDFTARDGDNLRKCCHVFAPFIARTWTPGRNW